MSKLLQTFKNDPGFYGAHVCSDGEQQLAAIDGRLCGVAAVQIAACNSAINYLIGQLLDNSTQFKTINSGNCTPKWLVVYYQ